MCHANGFKFEGLTRKVLGCLPTLVTAESPTTDHSHRGAENSGAQRGEIATMRRREALPGTRFSEEEHPK